MASLTVTWTSPTEATATAEAICADKVLTLTLSGLSMTEGTVYTAQLTDRTGTQAYSAATAITLGVTSTVALDLDTEEAAEAIWRARGAVDALLTVKASVSGEILGVWACRMTPGATATAGVTVVADALTAAQVAALITAHAAVETSVHALLLHNLAATAAPGVGDDSADGYAVGSRWIDTATDAEYVCLDATAGAAVWTSTTTWLDLSDDAPAALGVAAAGTGTEAARDDHVHVMPSAADVGAEPTQAAASQAEAEAGTEAGIRSFSPLRVAQAIAALCGGWIRTITATFDGGGAALVPGTVCYTRLPYGFTASKWSIIADQAGSLVLDVWVDSYANGLPTNADTVTNGHEPALTASATGEDADLADWSDVAWASGQIVAINIDSCTTITRATLVIEGVET